MSYKKVTKTHYPLTVLIGRKGYKKMTIFNTLKEVLECELRDIYNSEFQIVAVFPKMIARADSTQLRKAFEHHVLETKHHIARLDIIGDLLKMQMIGSKCRGTEGLIEEASEVFGYTCSNPALIDTLLIGIAQRIGHCEIASYGTAKAISDSLGLTPISTLLLETLEEEKAADIRLSVISEDDVLIEANDQRINRELNNKIFVRESFYKN